MKLSCMSKLVSFSLQNPRRNYGALPSLRPSKTPNPPSLSSSSSSSSTTLHDRIKVIRDPKASVLPVLEQWVTEGGAVEKQELQSLVRLLKDFRRFNHALEVQIFLTHFTVSFLLLFWFLQLFFLYMCFYRSIQPVIKTIGIYYLLFINLCSWVGILLISSVACDGVSVVLSRCLLCIIDNLKFKCMNS